ncbi:TPA: beta-CASP ribonuclease aCPSF1, partial [Candidatus Bathyarchaeota archaeon]|nr:beta-CASP ribonuclease aCPSF1 [Candidatus Bathyarchaeota archaeon]
MQKPQGLSYEEIRKTILEKIPAEVGITRIEFEGPRLAIYTQKPETLIEQSHIVGEIAGIIKKRIVVRS